MGGQSDIQVHGAGSGKCGLCYTACDFGIGVVA